MPLITTALKIYASVADEEVSNKRDCNWNKYQQHQYRRNKKWDR